MPTESLSELMTHFNDEGYTDTCRMEDDGLHFVHSAAVYPPEDVQVDRYARLEGTSAPDEEVVFFALQSPDGRFKGTFASPHGIDADPLDAEAIARLRVHAGRARRDRPDEGFVPQY